VSTGLAAALAGCLAVLAWLLLPPVLAARRRRKLVERSLSAAERALLAGTWPGYSRVPGNLAPQLDALTAVFLGEKEFIGCGGLVVTPAMRLSIAAQACLLELGHGRRPYEDLRSVLVYPSQFVVPDRWQDADGIVTEEELVLAGQAWDVGRILLSWKDIEDAGRDGEAYNVVIHEFAHYLDLEDGEADGIPRLGSPAARGRWAGVLRAEFGRVQRAVERGEKSFLDEYAAEDEAEFFAVASEAFFERPLDFVSRMPGLYGELRAYYGLDPAAWPAR
jgi:Mlc titration factor MtfA (ptsG expression regulator)